jgi:hypothetical protein
MLATSNLAAKVQFVIAAHFAFFALCAGQLWAAIFTPPIVLIVVDLLTRWFNADVCDHPLFNSEAGGSLGRIPVWCAAMIWIIVFGFQCLGA